MTPIEQGSALLTYISFICLPVCRLQSFLSLIVVQAWTDEFALIILSIRFKSMFLKMLF